MFAGLMLLFSDALLRPFRDGWSLRIAEWQARARPLGVVGGLPPRATGLDDGTPLADDYRAFRAEERRALAAKLAHWLQARAEQHYVADGVSEAWPLLEEVLARGGDDCDGLELLSYHLLRDFGYQGVYRAILSNPSRELHHMVTLWFEDPDDRWVIDPTGTASAGMPRLSELSGWQPRRVFTETETHSVGENTADPFGRRG